MYSPSELEEITGRIQYYREFVGDIDAGAQKEGVSVETLLKGCGSTYQNYRSVQQRLAELLDKFPQFQQETDAPFLEKAA